MENVLIDATGKTFENCDLFPFFSNQSIIGFYFVQYKE